MFLYENRHEKVLIPVADLHLSSPIRVGTFSYGYKCLYIGSLVRFALIVLLKIQSLSKELQDKLN